MSIEGLIITAILIFVALAVVTFPFMARPNEGENAFLNKQRERALAYYERVLTNLRDLDDDYTTAKIAPDEYQREREVWMERGVQLRQLLDELDANHNIVDDAHADDAQIDARIEAKIKSARALQEEVTA